LAEVSGLSVSKRKGHLWFADQPGCSCSLLSDHADFSADTWDLRADVVEPLTHALRLLGEEAHGFTFQAVWAGDAIESTSGVTLREFLAEVRANKIRNAHEYVVGRA
jgi:hypothetical protein